MNFRTFDAKRITQAILIDSSQAHEHQAAATSRNRLDRLQHEPSRVHCHDRSGRRVNLTGGSALREGRTEASPGQQIEVPLSFALRQAEPTPFSRSTRIRFDLPKAAWVHLDVFDLQGRRVAMLADEFLPPGRHAREWNGVSAEGGRARPGVYLYRVRAGEHSDQKKLVLTP